MTLGIAFYGISENMTDSTDLGSPIAGGGEGGPVLHQQGMMAYFEICKILNEQEGITSGRLPGTNAPFISSGNTWTGYDDPTSVQEKAEYVKQQGLSGVSLWTIDLDDFNGMCGDKNPLLHAVSNQFNPVKTLTVQEDGSSCENHYSASSHHRYRTVCYYAGWARWRQDPVTFHPEDADTGLCSHLVYAFASLDKDGLHIVPASASDTAIEKPNLKVMLAVGGWNLGSAEFSAMVSSENNIHSFAGAAIEFLHQYNFDGLDVDWEYPADRGSPPEDKHRFTQLMQVLHQRFATDHRLTNRSKLILSAAVSIDRNRVQNSYELPEVADAADFLNLIAYDMHGSWDTAAYHHSPLYSTTEDETDSIDYLINWILNTTVPPSKLNLGLALYGRTVNLTDPTNTAVGAPSSGGGSGGPLIGEEGFLAYYEICKILTETENVTSGRLSGTKAPYMVDGRRWTGYDDAQSIREKVDYVVQHDLGGVSVWSIDLDDFHGICGQGHYPMMHAIKNQFHSILVG
ncbi:hypothetical protein BaRGS_00026723 [Batillaria attramentaria]|uniref:GH18 domain-containing protein n=1 Tax=Batillaria attramentaria TaxID=370345 RepID=A0ABD0K3X3_9CAEN